MTGTELKESTWIRLMNLKGTGSHAGSAKDRADSWSPTHLMIKSGLNARSAMDRDGFLYQKGDTMTEAHAIMAALLVLILWIMGVIRLLPGSKSKAERDLAKTILKDNRGVFK